MMDGNALGRFCAERIFNAALLLFAGAVLLGGAIGAGIVRFLYY